MSYSSPPILRPRRNRHTAAIRALHQETTLTPADLIAPLFVKNGLHEKEPIFSLPGVFRFSPHGALLEAKRCYKAKIPAVALFPAIPSHLKDNEGSYAHNPKGLIPQTVELIKKELPSLCLIADIALDPYTSHGHDGIVTSEGTIANDATLEALARQAVLYAEAGADLVAPSATMDGRVERLREALDEQGFSEVGILSYTAKYASTLYTPFRSAIETTLQFGDKKTYQLNPTNCREALREAALNEKEGADMLLVKPALPYLDVLAAIKKRSFLPVGAYQVSGEYAMIMSAAKLGYLNAKTVFYETLTSIKRAGADFIFTYAAQQIADLLNSRHVPQ